MKDMHLNAPRRGRAALTLALASLLPSAGLAQPPQSADFSQALRELSIMENIFDASLEAEDGRRQLRFSGGPDSLYLAGQGMVFTFSPAGGWQGGGWENYWQEFSFNISQMVDVVTNELLNETFPGAAPRMDPLPPLPPAPPAASTGPGEDLERLRENTEALREQAQGLREAQRALQESQRELRAGQRQLRSRGEAAPDHNLTALEAELAKLEAEVEARRAALEGQRAAYQRSQAELEAERQETLNSRSLALAKEIVGTLCDYGRTLRSLQDDEHVTLIFKNYGQGKDQVLVFDMPAVRDCESADQLMDSALRYAM